jgi:hypothetical protein
LLSPFPHLSSLGPGAVRYVAPKTDTKTKTDLVLPPTRSDGVRNTVISTENQEAISKFIKSSVLPSTNRKYELQWSWFVQFIKDKGSDDPFMRTLTPQERAGMVSLFLMSRHFAGKRGKAASAPTAAIRQRFTQEMEDTAFLDSAIVSSARTACLPNPQELRELRSTAPASTVKLPVCFEMIADMRKRLVTNRTWCEGDMKYIMLYTGCVFGFEFTARVGEYTKAEQKATDHCLRTDDLSFAVEAPTGHFSIVGSALAELSPDQAGEGFKNVSECRVRGVTTKGKITVKARQVGRRSVEESLFLDDLIQFILHARAQGTEELFSFRKANGDRVVLTGRSVREEVKSTCERYGLDPDCFSAHSLRKGGITQMGSLGTSVEHMLARGSYAPNSRVMGQIYDQSVGLGPLGASSLNTGREPTVTDVKRLLPARRRSL